MSPDEETPRDNTVLFRHTEVQHQKPPSSARDIILERTREFGMKLDPESLTGTYDLSRFILQYQYSINGQPEACTMNETIYIDKDWLKFIAAAFIAMGLGFLLISNVLLYLGFFLGGMALLAIAFYPIASFEFNELSAFYEESTDDDVVRSPATYLIFVAIGFILVGHFAIVLDYIFALVAGVGLISTAILIYSKFEFFENRVL